MSEGDFYEPSKVLHRRGFQRAVWVSVREIVVYGFERTKKERVILSERSESKDLRTDFTRNVNEMRRFLDSLRSLGMTYLFLRPKLNNNFSHLPLQNPAWRGILSRR